MAGQALIPDDRTVYRGLRNSNWSKRGVVNYRAFLLRPANDNFAAEEELSLGLTREAAVDELKENFGIASLSVQAVHILPHNLLVRPDSQSEAKAEMIGLPLFSTDPDQRDLAIAIATDLAEISSLV
jgi:hypothetical protein